MYYTPIFVCFKYDLQYLVTILFHLNLIERLTHSEQEKFFTWKDENREKNVSILFGKNFQDNNKRPSNVFLI